MAKEGLLSRLIRAMCMEDINEQVEEQKVNFVMPEQEVLEALHNRRPLTGWQINQVIQAIKANYYLSDDKKYLDDFIVEWSLCNNDFDEILARVQQAYTRTTARLSAGVGVEISDALWISHKVYVDDLSPAKRRIITKRFEGGTLELDVKSQRVDAKVDAEMRQIKKQISETKYPKAFANGI